MKNLYNSIYSVLPEEKKKEILENLAKKYNRTLVTSVMSYLSSPSGETIKYSQHI